MMKLVDISDLGSDGEVRGGSSPSIRKKLIFIYSKNIISTVLSI